MVVRARLEQEGEGRKPVAALRPWPARLRGPVPAASGRPNDGSALRTLPAHGKQGDLALLLMVIEVVFFISTVTVDGRASAHPPRESTERDAGHTWNC